LTTSQLLLRGAFTGVAGALRLVASTLRATMVALIANPWFLMATAVLAAAARRPKILKRTAIEGGNESEALTIVRWG
jgi:hypothetical protein